MPSKPRSWLQSKDPGRRALRRGTRVALVVPLTLAALLQLPYVSRGALMGAFSSLAMLVFSDFAGPLRQRFTAYLATTAAGIPLVVLGAFAGQALWSSVVAMAMVAMVIGLLAVLRGLVAGAQSVLLLATVLAITTSTPTVVGPDVIAWTVGGVAAATSAVLLWPAHTSEPIRGRIAEVLDAVADASAIRWVDAGPPEDLARARQRVTTAIVELTRSTTVTSCARPGSPAPTAPGRTRR